MRKFIIASALALCAFSANAAGTYYLESVGAYNPFSPTPAPIAGAIPVSGTAVVDGAGNFSITGLQFSFINTNATFQYTNGTWSGVVGGTSITNTGTCVETAGTPCTGANSGLTAATANSSVFGTSVLNDGTAAPVPDTCFQANLVNPGPPPGECQGVSIVETAGTSLVLTEQSQFAFAGAASGYVYTFGTTIPVPAAVWLFGSALGLLGFARRRMS